MKYRKFGKLHWEISELSLGVLRLEDVAAGTEGMDREARNATIRYAIDQGVNYINLGYPACFEDPEGECAAVAKALDGGYRDKVKLAVNIPGHSIASVNDLDRLLETQRRWFGLDKVDFCIIDGVDRFVWEKLRSIGFSEWADNVVGSGRADYMGISFHDDAHYLNQINIDFPRLSVVQLELSLLDYKHHPGVGGFKFTEQYGNAVVATDVTKAGRLLHNIPPNVQEIWDQASPKRSIAEWCLRWTLNFSEVASALIHCDTAEQVRYYILYAEMFKAGDADVWEMLQAAKIRDAYYSNRFIQCTACRCCMPCEIGIDVPRVIELYNDCVMFSDEKLAELRYHLENHTADACIGCQACVKSCPKHFPITDVLSHCRNLLHLAKLGDNQSRPV